ncbi:MAG: parallel beta-helix repeat protein [Verrucomicrobiales bacterium]|jgi:parallel beta-helix repeat protein
MRPFLASRFFLCLNIIIHLPRLTAAEIHVSATGNDTASGTRDLPLRTIQAGCDRATAGDTIHVSSGIYKEHIELNSSGDETSGAITLQAEKGAIIEGNSGTRDVIQIYDQSYIRVIGFEIRNHRSPKEASGIRIEGSGSHIEIRDNTIHEIRGENAMGITVYGTSSDVPLSKIIIDGNTIHDCDPAKSEALTLNGNIDGFEVTNNHIHDVNNIGIDFIGGEKSIVGDAAKVTRNGLCARNRVFRARSIYGGGYAAGIYVDGAQNMIIEENIVSECDLGIEIGAENKGSLVTKIVVRNNTLYANDKAGIVVGGYSKNTGNVRDCTFDGNVCFHNTGHKKAIAECWIQHASALTFRNNIIVGTGSKPLVYCEPAASNNTLQNNTWFTEGTAPPIFAWRGREWQGLAAFQSGTEQATAGTFKRPSFSNPAEGDFTRSETALPLKP